MKSFLAISGNGNYFGLSGINANNTHYNINYSMLGDL